MAKAIAALFGIILIFVISVAIMIYGWGLQPVSWGWIIGGYFSMLILTALTQTALAK